MFVPVLYRLREERTDERQQMGGVAGIVVGGGEQKPRDLSSRNCKFPEINENKKKKNHKLCFIFSIMFLSF